MFDIVPPMPPPFGVNISNPSSPNRAVEEDPRDTNVLEFIKGFFQLKDRLLVYLDGLEPYLLEILENGPFVPLRLANQDKRLKSILISCLPNDVMKSVIKCTSCPKKPFGTDLILAHEGPSETKDTRIAALRLKFDAFKALEGERVNGTFTRLKSLLNDLENNGVYNFSFAEVNVTLINSLPRKGPDVDQIYKSESTRFTFQASNLKALISNPTMQDSDSDIEEDQRSSSEFLADLNDGFHERALLANQRRFCKRPGRACSFMLCDLDFEPLSLSLSSLPSCDLVSFTNILILCLILKASNQSLRKSLSLNLELS
ncbi:hypothetical protein Tco_0810124 [Tanacetum coccineum]